MGTSHRMAESAITAVFFDLGGTLATANPSVTELIAQVLADHGYQIPHRDLARAANVHAPRFEDPRNHGWSLSHERSYAFWTQFYTALLAEIGIPSHARAALTASIYARLSRPEGYRLYPDALPTLERLAGAGYTLGLVSNWEAWGAELVARLGLSRYFPEPVLSGCVGVEKPDTRIFKLALAQAGLAPGRVLYVGDDVRNDVEPARAVGMSAILLRRQEDGKSADAPYCIRSLRELCGHELLG